MTKPIRIAAHAAPCARSAARLITLASVLVLGALVAGCATKTNTGASVAERSIGTRTGAETAAGDRDGASGASSTAAGGTQAGTGGRTSSGTAGSTAGGRAADGTSADGRAGADSSLYGDSEDGDETTDDFAGIAGDEAAAGNGAGGTAGGGRAGSRPGSRAAGSTAASPNDDTSASSEQGADGASMRDGTAAGGAGGSSREGGAAGSDGTMAGADGAGGGAGGEGVAGARGRSGRAGSSAGGAGADGDAFGNDATDDDVADSDYDGGDGSVAGGRRSGGAGAGDAADGDAAGGDAVGGAASDQEAMVVGMVDAPGSRVRIEEDVTPQTLGGMLPLAVGVDEQGQFDFDQAVLRPEVKSVLDELAGRLRDAEWDRLDILGYTDRIGTDEYNQQLSERRAWAVARYLVAQGIPVSKMRVEGRGERSSQVDQGECQDLERSELIACLQKDRRVEIEASIRKTEAKIQ